MTARLHCTLGALVALAMVMALHAPSEAQLAGSGWPMLGHDPQHTGLSTELGPKFPGIAPGANDVRALTFYDKIKMFPATGHDGSVYVGMGWQFCGLKPLDVSDPNNPVFAPKWNLNPTPASPMGAPINAPIATWPNIGCWPTNADVSASGAAVDPNDYVYFGDRDNSVYKYRGSDGLRMWSYSHGHEGDVHASPTIGLDNRTIPPALTVYFVFSQNSDGNGSILAVKDTGNLIVPAPNLLPASQIKWKFAVGQYGTTSSPALATDATDHAPLLIVGFADAKVRAIRDQGTSAALKWATTVGVGTIAASPVISADGKTAYIGGYGAMYALDVQTGSIKWKFSTSPANVDSTAALKDGVLYFVARFANDRTVYAINAAGLDAKANPTPADLQNAILWKFGPTNASLSSAGGFITLAADGILYVAMGSGVYAIQPNTGTLLWKYLTTNGVISGAALGSPAGDTEARSDQGGTAVLYFGSQDRNVYAIKSKRVALSQNDPPNPLFDISPAPPVLAGTDVTFDASKTTDPQNDPIFYSWNLGDGTTLTGKIVHHAYSGPNMCGGSVCPYQVTLTANDGMASKQLTKPLLVNSGSPSFFCDAFTRTNSSTLGSPGTSAPPCPSPSNSSLQWQEDSPPLAIGNNQMVTETAPVKTNYIATVTGFQGMDQAAAVDFTSTLNSTAPRFGIVLRFIDAKNYYLAYRWVGGASVLRISKVVNGVETVLAQKPVANPTVNVPFRLNASVSGSALSLELDGGATLLTATDSTFQNVGRVGVLFNWSVVNTPSYTADNFNACVGPPGADCAVRIQ